MQNESGTAFRSERSDMSSFNSSYPRTGVVIFRDIQECRPFRWKRSNRHQSLSLDGGIPTNRDIMLRVRNMNAGGKSVRIGCSSHSRARKLPAEDPEATFRN